MRPGPAARPLTPDDLDWLVRVLQVRRDRLRPHAPVFWRAAADASARHRAWLAHVLGDCGGRGWRTDDAALVATPHDRGWLLDDVVAPGDDWEQAHVLWEALATASPAAPVRFVCPVVEPARTGFARDRGLALHESWWLLELDGPGGGPAGEELDLGGSVARTVAAPPVYAPPGPVLFLPGPVPDPAVLRSAPGEATRRGCSAVVVTQAAGDQRLGAALHAAGFRRHCDYFTGVLEHP